MVCIPNMTLKAHLLHKILLNSLGPNTSNCKTKCKEFLAKIWVDFWKCSNLLLIYYSGPQYLFDAYFLLEIGLGTLNKNCMFYMFFFNRKAIPRTRHGWEWVVHQMVENPKACFWNNKLQIRRRVFFSQIKILSLVF